jgi:hypothetical protein
MAIYKGFDRIDEGTESGYLLPQDGIPYSDLHQDVQDALDLTDDLKERVENLE